MSIVNEKAKRRILPRWRTSAAAMQSADLVATRPPPVLLHDDGSHLLETRYAFEKEPSIGTAADLIAAASMGQDSAAAELAAGFVLENEERAPRTLLALARSLLEKQEPAAQQNAVRDNGALVAHTRALLRLNPINPALWSDMARHYASHGDRREADRCMRVALQLAPDNRWLLRVAVRFFVHSENAVAAHKLLAQHPRTSVDPWLIAAELATAQVAQRPPKFWRQANDMLKAKRVAPLHLSELATAVGMFELEGGEAKKARKLAEIGLREPTENTLAQISWAREYRHMKGAVDLDKWVRHTSNAYEADFRLRSVAGDLLSARVAGLRWAYDEPFAARPLSGLAFIACVLDDYANAVKCAHDVKLLDGKIDETLEMNTLCARMSSGDKALVGDQRAIDAMHARILVLAKNQNAYHAAANLALWHYRFGDPEVGGMLYQQAINAAEKIGALEAAAMAAAYAAREAIIAQQPRAQNLVAQAAQLSKRSRDPVAEFYTRKVDDLLRAPHKVLEILSPASAARYLAVTEPNPTQSVRLIKGREGLIAIAPPRRPSEIR